ncbi:MAG: glycerophosphodiester phosphodiesterase family protein [Candidatus Marinimicrobia bacterium]|nr:glycerophosphodiester phosphodiesterase family protein [Candidatus Neomarinimicrobiota bacterium]
MLKKIILLLLITSFLLASPPYPLPDLSFDTVEELQAFFSWDEDRIPVLSAHRGGPYPGYPENCIESFENILDHIPSTLEVDISVTKDSVLILMHDWSLDRTTTGTGSVNETLYDDLDDLFLEDNDGNQTPYLIPTLEKVLLWAKGKTVLNLDIKRGVPFKKVIDLVHQTGTQASVLIIVYSIEDGVKVNRLDPELMLSLAIRNEEELLRAKEAGIPMDRVTAFTGTHLQKKKLYNMLHEEKVFANCGTLGNLDKKAETKGDHLYKRWEKLGIDIFATDRPLEVARILYEDENDEK